MDFPFYVVDLRDDFGARVIGNFVAEYLAGRTPNPCVMCNREIKFDRLWSRARALDADYRRDRPLCANRARRRTAATICGARPIRPRISPTFCLRSAQRELARTLFPLGAMTKTEVRARARALGLANADKPESQEICFVPDGDYARFVERAARRTSSIAPGHIVDSDGSCVSRDHAGIHRFTVGQRRGLGIAARRAALCAGNSGGDRRGRRRPTRRIECARDSIAA